MPRKSRFRRKRPLPAPLSPLVYRWDLDKTYLKTEFDSVRQLVRIPFEKPEDKKTAPGVAALIRALRENATAGGRAVHTYFISASPPQIGRAIKRKLELDGVAYDGIVFKDQLRRLMRGKFRHLREQVGFKVTELLKARLKEPPDTREYLFGDDWESDPLLYSLYADVVAGRVEPEQLAEILGAIRVDPPLVHEARHLAARIEPANAVARIFITLERRTPLADFRCFGARLVPTFNYFQTAAVLFEEQVLGLEGVTEVAQSLVAASAYTPERLMNSLNDILRREHVSEGTPRVLREHLRTQSLVPPAPQPPLWQQALPWLRSLWSPANGRKPEPAPASMAIDYLAILARREG